MPHASFKSHIILRLSSDRGLSFEIKQTMCFASPSNLLGLENYEPGNDVWRRAETGTVNVAHVYRNTRQAAKMAALELPWSSAKMVR